ncbi:DHA1 family L-arabinose/isopropyl-beta-D-thiogalactopyranoside export protein-like MFS transporter [Orbus hercynius]|uniref:DHA1 family L-arabinose/isopropyl-beta-D-thiogalactopyranoside export protein-like MFS transporter n=1 Tax=Orbus hercynius TaxID=593135 RepID=A0A495RK19_9GAMM|nr:sugar transporter [Orbus hercynius]RKS87785.1 DHA1 family L-arabinose/isopropyl-beta-D-thiogalactopyranoside export protein-like MFS transporter [Orbus hercynius]
MHLYPVVKRSQAWSAILCLAFAAFIFNTTEFVPVGLLPNIAASFDMTVGHTGLLITIYAWAVSLLSLPLTIITAKFERKHLLIGLFLLFIASHILAGFAWSFESLMVARIGIACAHAVFWAITTPLAVRLAPSGKKAKAMGFIVAGSSMAIVLGVPIGTMVGQLVGWRITFLCIGVVAFGVMLALIYLLPKLPSTNTQSLHNLPSLLRRPVLVHVYILTAIVITGHFTAYTYITPFMHQIGGFDDYFVVILLLCIGLSGIIGSVIFALYADKYPIILFVYTLALLAMCLALFYLSSLHSYSAIALCLVWGTVITIFGMLMQSKVLEIAPDGTDIAMSVYSGIYNIGIGGGALAGSFILQHLSIAEIGYIGALFVVFALLIFVVFSHSLWLNTQKNAQQVLGQDKE